MMVFLNLIDSAEDKEKFKHFYNKYVGMVIWIAKSRLRDNQSLAEECAQETFLYFAKNFSKIEEVDSLKTKSYVGVVATAYAIKCYHAEFERYPKIPDMPEGFEEADDALSVYDTYELKDAISSLNEEMRTVIYMKYVLGMKLDEMSKMCGMSEYLLRKNIREARDLIKKYLDKED